MQLSFDKACAFKGVQVTTGGIDLMIVDIPEGLPVHMVPFPTSILKWNSEDENFLLMVIDFESSLMHDNEVLLLFYKDNLKLRADIRGSAKAYQFKILKEWIGINRLPITSTKDASKVVSSSSIVICFILLNTNI